MKKILIVEIALAVLCVAATAALWQYPFALAGVLLGIGGVFIRRSRAKHPYLAYVGAALGGALSESIVIYFGAWAYTAPHLVFVPAWLPLLWGNAALFIIAMSHSSD
jgi:hypothetical protein